MSSWHAWSLCAPLWGLHWGGANLPAQSPQGREEETFSRAKGGQKPPPHSWGHFFERGGLRPLVCQWGGLEELLWVLQSPPLGGEEWMIPVTLRHEPRHLLALPSDLPLSEAPRC